MKATTLDQVKTEIEAYLRENNFVVFYGYSRAYDESAIVSWDSVQRPDYMDFIKVAEAVGVRFVVLHVDVFGDEAIEDLENGLEGLELPAGERRQLEKRIKDLEAYTGMVSALELSFNFDNQVYMMTLEATWHDEYEELYEELMLNGTEMDIDTGGGDPTMGGFFSKN